MREGATNGYLLADECRDEPFTSSGADFAFFQQGSECEFMQQRYSLRPCSPTYIHGMH